MDSEKTETGSRTGNKLTVDDMIENLVEAFLVASKIEDIVDLLGQKIFEDKIKMAPQQTCPITRNFGNESFLFGIQDHHFFHFRKKLQSYKKIAVILNVALV